MIIITNWYQPVAAVVKLYTIIVFCVILKHQYIRQTLWKHTQQNTIIADQFENSNKTHL